MVFHRLKKIPLLAFLNSSMKARRTKAVHQSTLDFYSNKSEISISESWYGRAQRIVNAYNDNELRIFFAGTDKQQDKNGFLQALQKIGDVRCFVRSDGGWGQNDPSPYVQRRAKNTQRLDELFVANAKEGWVPHLLIMQTWACLLEPACLSRLRSLYGVFIVNVAMDDRHQYWGSKFLGEWDGTYPLIPHIDLTLTAAPEAVSWYRKEGGVAFYFPEASDPKIFHPMPYLPKIHDISFVGGRYGIRERIVGALRNAGIRVSAYGNGWESGRISTSDIPALFAQSKIILGVGTIGHSKNFCALKMRDFDAPMSGSCYLTTVNSDFDGLYDLGKEIITYKGVTDCVTKALRLLSNDIERESVARCGRLRAVQNHTWDHRFRVLLDFLSSASQRTFPPNCELDYFY